MISALATLTQAFWGMCTFRVAPQDMPASTVLLGITTVANVVLSTLINQIRIPLGSSMLVALLELLVLFGLTSALLFVMARPRRIVQTLTALMGTGALIGAIVLAVLVVFPSLPQPLRMAIFLWNLFVMAHVLRHALDTRFIVGFFVAIGYALFLIQLVIFVDRMLAGMPA